MRKNRFRLEHVLVTVALLGGLLKGMAGESTAYELVEEGNKHLGIEARGRVVQIRSEKSIGSMEPSIWFVVYYDPDATAKAAEVKFIAGKKVSVKRPARLLEPLSGKHKELDRDRMKIDSDQAIRIAISEPILKNLTLTATKLKLERWGDHDGPVWRVEIWAQKLRRPEKDVRVGEVILAADDGKVLKSDLKISRVD